jgi:hypothetical protein
MVVVDCRSASTPNVRLPVVEPTARLEKAVMRAPKPTVVVVESRSVLAADVVVKLVPIVVVVVLINKSSPEPNVQNEPKLTVPVAAPTTRSPPDVITHVSPTVIDPNGNANSSLPPDTNTDVVPTVKPLLDERRSNVPPLAVILTLLPRLPNASMSRLTPAYMDPSLPMVTPP